MGAVTMPVTRLYDLVVLHHDQLALVAGAVELQLGVALVEAGVQHGDGDALPGDAVRPDLVGVDHGRKIDLIRQGTAGRDHCLVNAHLLYARKRAQSVQFVGRQARGQRIDDVQVAGDFTSGLADEVRHGG